MERKKTDLERYLEEQERMFQDTELRAKERFESLLDRDVNELFAKEGEAYKSLLRTMKAFLISERGVDRNIAGELAEQLVTKMTREHLEKQRREE